MTDTAAPLSPLVESQLQMLGDLAAAGLDAARAVARAANADQAPASEIALAYARVSRAVRLAIMLQTQLVKDQHQAEIDQRKARGERAEARKNAIGGVVKRLVEAEHPDDEETLDALMTATYDRLDDEGLYGDILERPFDEIVELICKDLGLGTRPLPLAGEGDPEGVERAYRSDALQRTVMPSLSASLTSLPPTGETAMAWPPPPVFPDPAPPPDWP